MSRQHKPTSKQGEQHIAPFKQSHKEKIVAALMKMNVGGTFDEISEATGLRPDQTWKRLSECQKDGTIYDSGLTRKLKSGVNGIIWKIKEEENWFRDVFQNEKPKPTFYQPNLL